MAQSQVKWQDVAKEFQSRRDALLPEKWRAPQDELAAATQSTTRVAAVLPKWLSAEEKAITTLDATSLAAAIRGRTYSALQVAEAFCHRATLAQQLTNCLTEVFFDEALARARELDAHQAATGETVGPLHGVPVSVKDHYNVAGHYTTAGYIAYADRGRSDTDAHIVTILRNAGAVLYAKTNNPQCMMVVETVSNIYGRTLNPHNTTLAAGGSSGGEGALIGLHGSPLGVGSDIGGSIRVPAAFNGLYGFKPSGKRIVPTGGWVCTGTGAESITAVSGPIGRSVDDLELFFQIVSDAQPWLREPMLAFPWVSQTSALQGQKLTIGLQLWDEVVMPHPYVTRVLQKTAAKLRAAGHTVVDVPAYDHKRAWDDILLPLYFTDGGLDIRQTLAAGGDEPMLPSAARLVNDPIVRERAVLEIWKLNIDRDVYRGEYLAKWAATATAAGNAAGRPIDVLLCPSVPCQGTPHDFKPWWGYCSQWNLLDYPSSVIPAGRVLATDAYPADYEPANDLDRENYELFNIDRYNDLPVTIQIVGQPYQDEKVMAATKIIDTIVNA